jgi:hypothetical protein
LKQVPATTKFFTLSLLFMLTGCFLGAHAQFLAMPRGEINRVDIGRLNVSGHHITVEALITVEDASIDANIVSKHTRPDNVNYVLRSGGFFVKTTGTGGVVGNPVRFCPNQTYHVAGTYDGKYLRYFVNGVLVGMKPCTGEMYQNNEITSIGNMSARNSTAEQYHGYISEVRIWNVARTQPEIAANMLDLPDPTTQSGLLAYYKFQGTLLNLQGDARWQGKPSKKLAIGRNPYFSGAVSSTFCGGDTNIAQALTLAMQKNTMPAPQTSEPPPAPKPIPKPAVSQARSPVKPPEPPPAKLAPQPQAFTAGPLPPAKTDSILLSIRVWDFDGLDGDSISLKLNGKPLGPPVIALQEFKRYDSPEFTYATMIPPGDNNVLTITALNEGSLGLATVGLLITDDYRGQRYFFRLKKGESVTINFVKKTG